LEGSRRLDLPCQNLPWCNNSASQIDGIDGKAVRKLCENGVMDLIAVSGYYDVVSMTLNVAHVAPPKEAQLPFKQAGR
jgi:hypothetical protein